MDEEEISETAVVKKTEMPKTESSVKRRRKRKCSSPKQRATKVHISYKEDSSSEDELTVSEYINTRISLRPRDNNTFVEEADDESLTEVEDELNDSEYEVQKTKASTPKRNPGRTKIQPPTTKKKRGPVPKVEKKTIVATPSNSLLCKTCNIQFYQKDLYREHRDKMHKGDRHSCVECGKTFNRANRPKSTQSGESLPGGSA